MITIHSLNYYVLERDEGWRTYPRNNLTNKTMAYGVLSRVKHYVLWMKIDHKANCILFILQKNILC